MDVESSANAVTGAVAVVEPLRPQRGAGERVQGQPRRALWEHRRIQPYVPLHSASPTPSLAGYLAGFL